MIDLRKAVLPSSIEVDGDIFFVQTDFHFWIDFCVLAKKEDLEYRDLLFLFTDKTHIPLDPNKAFSALMEFAYPKKELPRVVGNQTKETLYDWILDGDLIYAAFMQQYKIDLCDEKMKMHWHKFLALFNGLQNTKFDDVIGYRSYDPGKKYDEKKERMKLKNMWEIRRELTEREKKTLDNFRSHLKC